MRATFLNLREESDKLHTEGRPRPGVKIEIRDDSNNALPCDAVGIICISGKAVASGYTNPEEWEKHLTPDGWYRSGDLGMLDCDGYLVFLGRSDDVVNVNGNLVHPGEVDSRLSTLINQPFCVVGIRDPRGHRDTVLVVCIEGKSNITIDSITRHLSNSARHLIPSYVIPIPALPRTATGKIKRSETARIVTASFAGTRS
jgi:acyl-CoA synthetase (AMP-forming)/AMP-acid ligase II